MHRLTALMFAALCHGCGTPGSTVDVLGANPSSISFEYTRWWSDELPAAMKMAQEHCRLYGKNARLANTGFGSNPIDRDRVTFDCVP